MKEDFEKYIKEIERKLKKVKTRLRLFFFLNSIVYGFFLVFASAALFSLTQKFFGLSFSILNVAGLLFFSAFLGSILSLFLKRINLITVAQNVDVRVNLKERISSSLLLKGIERPFVFALIEDSFSQINMLDLKKEFPFEQPQYLKKFILSLLCFLAITFILPEINLLSKEKEQKKLREKKSAILLKEADKLKNIANKLKEKIPEKKDDLSKIAKQIEDLSEDLRTKPKEPREILSKISKVEEDLKLRKEALNENFKEFKNLKLPIENKFTKDLAEAMKDSNFDKAMQEMKKLEDLLKSDQLSKEDRERLSKELSQIADQLKDSPQLSEIMSEMAKAVQAKNVENLSQLMKQAQGEMGNLCELMEEMKLLDNVECDMEARRAALLGNKIGMFKFGETDKIGAGIGGPGRGRGGKAPLNPDAQTSFKDSKIAGQKGQGKIIGVFFVNDRPIKGESKVEFENVYLEYLQKAEDSLSREIIPVTYKNYIRDYFDSINPQNLSGATEEKKDKIETIHNEKIQISQ